MAFCMMIDIKGMWLQNAVLATSIASNAVIEHGKFETRIIGAFMLCSWVYPVTAHWIWSKDGWLSMHLDKEDMYYGGKAY